jgi:ectoine hydroxylase-related dioxygenase (phytanoyl-CoA dioxygenase family)
MLFNEANVPELLRTYHEEGYIKLEGVLSQDRVDRLNAAIDEILAEEPQSYNYSIRNAAARHSEVAALIDDPHVLPLIVNILGYNIQLHLSHLTVRHHNPDQEPSRSKKNTVGWHQDGPVPAFPSVGGVMPLMYLKICYILSDLTDPYRGNTKIVPRSGDSPFTPVYKDENEVEGELQICGQPGDAFIFPQNLWHAAAPNLTTISRRQLFIGYSYLWMRPLDYHQVEPHQLENASPIRRQLLGQLDEEPFNYYVVTKIQTPLPLQAYLIK